MEVGSSRAVPPLQQVWVRMQMVGSCRKSEGKGLW